MYSVKYGDVHQKVLALEKYETLLKEENTLARHDYKIWINSLDHMLYIWFKYRYLELLARKSPDNRLDLINKSIWFELLRW